MDNNIRKVFSEIVGVENVLFAQPSMEKYTTATFAHSNRPLFAVLPASTAEVQECMKVAGSFGLSVYPISRGRNTGYGSAVPTDSGCVVLDLSRMDKIIEYNEQLGYVTVEPGVTFISLFRFLREQRSSLYISVTGGPAQGSIIGNIADRGLGSGIYADRAEHCCGFEVVLANGDVIRTGYSRFDGARAAAVHRSGVGPSLDGLFLQSNFGVITRMTLWLMPMPKELTTFTFSIAGGGAFPNAINALQKALFHSLCRNTYLFLWNDLKQFSGRMRYPFGMAGDTPLPDELRVRLRTGEEWGGMGAIYGGSKELSLAEQALISSVLTDHVKDLVFISKSADEIETLWEQALACEDLLDPATVPPYKIVEGILLGVPTDANLSTCYWRKKDLPRLQWTPEKDNCGVYALTITSPFTGNDVSVAVTIIDTLCAMGGFEAQISVSRLKERTLDIITFIAFDRDVEGQEEKALFTYHTLLEKLKEAGFLPCRLSTHSMKSLPQANDDSADFYKKLRNAVDPDNILAPGRYVQ